MYAQLDASTQAITDMRAPIFYDRNDTGYYANPNGNSQFNLIFANNWFRSQNDTGWLNETYGRGIWTTDSGSNSYGNVTTYGPGRNGWYGWGIGTRHVFMSTTGDNVGVHDNSRGWIWYWDGGYTQFPYGYTFFGGSARSPLFYDNDNTGYYGNFAGTSVMSSIALGGAGSVPQGVLWANGEIWISGNGNRVAFTTDTSTDGTPNASVRGSSNDLVVQNWSGSASNDNFWVFGASRDAACAGNITAYYSDERLKTKTGNLDNALEKVKSLEGFTYMENELARSVGYNNNKQQVGLSAQKVKAVLPEAVALAPFDYDPQDDGTILSKSGEEYLTVDYSRLVPLLIEAIKELTAKVEELEAR
jgi:hypothetical protein